MYVCYLLDYNFIVKHVCGNTVSCIPHRYDCFSGRDVRIDPEVRRSDPEVQVNAAVLTEDPDQSPEEPKANLASDYREGKPRT